MGMTDIWRPVIGFEKYYEVSSNGTVRSISNNTRYRPNQKPIILKPFLSEYGYYQVTLTINGNRFLKRVNRLVAEAFIPNPENKPCVNHKFGIKTDNRVSELEWATYSENEQHSIQILNKSIKGNKKTYPNGINPKSKQVLCIETNTIYNSVNHAAISLNLHRSNLVKQIKGELKTTGGFTFRFL